MYVHGETIIYDLHGSFSSGRKIFNEVFNCLPRVHIFNYNGVTPCYDDMTYSTDVQCALIESLNWDVFGMLISMQGETDIRQSTTEYPLHFARLYHDVVENFIGFSESRMNEAERVIAIETLPLLKRQTWDTISNYVQNCVRSCKHYKPSHHMIKHSVRLSSSLTDLANHYNTDKGDAYKCAHGYTRIYEKVFAQLLEKDHFNMMEIGLNRDGTDDIPSIRMWRDYFGERASLYGVDIQSAFLKYNDPSARIHISIADQSCKLSLQTQDGLTLGANATPS